MACIPRRAAARFIRRTKAFALPDTCRASNAATLFAEGSSTASSACRSVRRSPCFSATIDCCCARRRAVSATSDEVTRKVKPLWPSRSGCARSTRPCRHHLRQTRDRDRRLARARVRPAPDRVRGLTVHRPAVRSEVVAIPVVPPAVQDDRGGGGDQAQHDRDGYGRQHDATPSSGPAVFRYAPGRFVDGRRRQCDRHVRHCAMQALSPPYSSRLSHAYAAWWVRASSWHPIEGSTRRLSRAYARGRQTSIHETTRGTTRAGSARR